MQQRAQLCFNGNFLVDRSEYPPLASRVLTSSGVAALPIRRDAYAQDGAQGHLSSEGLGGDPKHRGAIRPKPQCKLSRMSQLLTIYTNPPGYKQSCLCAFVHNARRSVGRGQGPCCGGTATVINRGALPVSSKGSGVASHLTPEQLPGSRPQWQEGDRMTFSE